MCGYAKLPKGPSFGSFFCPRADGSGFDFDSDFVAASFGWAPLTLPLTLSL
jgi:hypothetical protein